MSEEPRRVQLSRKKGARLPENTVRVARPGRWGNPFQVALVGRELAVEMFRDLLNGFFDPFKLKHLTDAEFKDVYDAKTTFEKRLNWGAEIRSGARHELRGKNLACWCALCERHKDGKPLDEHCPDCKPCHVDPLGEIANRPGA